MILKTLNEDKAIRYYQAEQVTNHYMEGPGSLFDPNIFGYGEDRKRKFGYITLNGHYVRPNIFVVARRMFRDLSSIVDGSKKFKITKDGDLVPDPEGNTGLEWFYDNYDKIKLKKLQQTEGVKLQTKLMKNSFDKLTKEQFFIDKLLVMPLHYRDIDTSKNTIKVDELNNYYMDLIKATGLKSRLTGMMNSYFIDIKIQGLIISIYEYISRGTFGKNGLQRKGVMGKSIDNSARMVIVAPEIKPNDKIGKTRFGLDMFTIPLHHFLNSHPVQSTTATRMVLQDFMNRGLLDMTQEEFDIHFSDEEIGEFLKSFDESQIERLSTVKDHKGNTIDMYFEFKPENGGTTKKETRAITWTDLFYMATSLFRNDCRAILTRYPVTGQKSIVPGKLHVRVFNDDEGDVKIFHQQGDSDPIYSFEHYPDVSKYTNNLDMADRIFAETCQMSNMNLSELNGDYDGDKISLKTIYSKEGRMAIDKIISKPTSMLSLTGNNQRTIAREALQGLYNLTYIDDKDLTKSKVNEPKSRLLANFFTKEDYTLEEILKLIDENEIYDVVNYKGNLTTLGRVIFNEVLFNHIPHHKFYNSTIFKKDYGKITNKYAAEVIDGKITLDDYKTILNRGHDLGFGITDVVAASPTSTFLIKEDNVYETKRKELLAKYQEDIDKGDILAMQKFENEVIEFAKEHYKNDPSWHVYNSGAKASWTNDFKALKVSLGAIPDPGVGTTIVTNSLRDGMENDDIMAVSNLQRSGAYYRAQATAQGGYIVKKMNSAFQSVSGFRGDCGSTRYLKVTEHSADELLYRYIKGPKGLIKITPDNVDKYIGKEIEKRDPIFCKHPKGYCSTCLGDLLFDLKHADTINIGMEISQIGSDILNTYMGATHDMGAKVFEIKDLDEYVEK